MELKLIDIDFENTPESFLARIDYRETQDGQGMEFLPGELVFTDAKEDMGKAETGGVLC